ncbi:hypothetical protein ACWGDE_18645, partial [Streptomyces sp. NPDC054956]
MPYQASRRTLLTVAAVAAVTAAGAVSAAVGPSRSPGGPAPHGPLPDDPRPGDRPPGRTASRARPRETLARMS